jgi:hypothetical protein
MQHTWDRERREMHKVVTEKPEGKRKLDRPRSRRRDIRKGFR